MAKLKKDFGSGPKEAFHLSASVAGKMLTVEQIERITHDLIRLRVMKAHDEHHLKEKLKQYVS